VIDTSSGQPFAGDPRGVLKRAIERAEDMGYEVNAAPEPEFFLFEEDEEGRATTKTNDVGGYFDLAPKDLAQDVRRDIIFGLEDMGFDIEASHHEVAEEGQHEINFTYDDALSTADNVATFRAVVRAIASEHDLHATFMPKPIARINGSGMHTHFSLFQDGENAFHDDDDEFNLSEVAKQFTAGILDHAEALSAITNPTVNSYKRLVPGYEAPVYVAWSDRNRSALIRKPAARTPRPRASKHASPTRRVTRTSPSPRSSTPASTASTATSTVTTRSARTSTSSTRRKRDEYGITTLPSNLGEAIEALEADDVVQDALGEHVRELRRSEDPGVRGVHRRSLRVGTRPVPRATERLQLLNH